MTTMFLTDVYSNPDEYVSSLKKKDLKILMMVLMFLKMYKS
mgnify:CR=1 FL=1